MALALALLFHTHPEAHSFTSSTINTAPPPILLVEWQKQGTVLRYVQADGGCFVREHDGGFAGPFPTESCLY